MIEYLFRIESQTGRFHRKIVASYKGIAWKMLVNDLGLDSMNNIWAITLIGQEIVKE